MLFPGTLRQIVRDIYEASRAHGDTICETTPSPHMLYHVVSLWGTQSYDPPLVTLGLLAGNCPDDDFDMTDFLKRRFY